MREQQHLSLHYLIRAAILAGFAFYVVYLERLEKLQYYIAPKMIPYVKYTAVALFLLAIYFIHLALRDARENREEECDCGHAPPRSPIKSVMVYGLFVLPLALGFALPDKIMGSDVVAVKGISLNGAYIQPPRSLPSEEAPPGAADNALPAEPEQVVSELPQQEQTAPDDSGNLQGEPDGSETVSSEKDALLDSLFPYDEYTMEHAQLAKRLYEKEFIPISEDGFLEIITAIDLYRDQFLGKKVELSGFVYREDDMRDDQFAVSRMAMTCCSADAMPYGLLSQSSRAANYNKDDWITLTGIIGLTEYNGVEIIQLEAVKVVKLDTPSNPYVFPYFGDFSALVPGD